MQTPLWISPFWDPPKHGMKEEVLQRQNETTDSHVVVQHNLTKSVEVSFELFPIDFHISLFIYSAVWPAMLWSKYNLWTGQLHHHGFVLWGVLVEHASPTRLLFHTLVASTESSKWQPNKPSWICVENPVRLSGWAKQNKTDWKPVHVQPICNIYKNYRATNSLQVINVGSEICLRKLEQKGHGETSFKQLHQKLNPKPQAVQSGCRSEKSKILSKYLRYSCGEAIRCKFLSCS